MSTHRITSNRTPAQPPLTPTKEHARNARRLATFANDPTCPRIVRAAFLSLIAQLAAPTETNVLYNDHPNAPADGELYVSPSDLAFMLLETDRGGLEFSERGIIDAEGNYLKPQVCSLCDKPTELREKGATLNI